MLWKPLGYLGDFIMLSLLWAACCIPVVTIGSSTTALYDAAVLRQHHAYSGNGCHDGRYGVLKLSFRNPYNVMPGLVAYVSTFLIEPVFRKYQEKEE